MGHHSLKPGTVITNIANLQWITAMFSLNASGFLLYIPMISSFNVLMKPINYMGAWVGSSRAEALLSVQ